MRTAAGRREGDVALTSDVEAVTLGAPHRAVRRLEPGVANGTAQTVERGGYAPSERAITICCTSSVPSPIVRILASR